MYKAPQGFETQPNRLPSGPTPSLRNHPTVTAAAPVLEEIVPALSEMRAAGLGIACDRLEYLYQIQTDDPDEPAILLDSLLYTPSNQVAADAYNHLPDNLNPRRTQPEYIALDEDGKENRHW